MFEFVGKVLGIAMRTKNFMPFRFPPLVRATLTHRVLCCCCKHTTTHKRSLFAHMPLQPPKQMWKPLVGQQVSRQDLEGVDGLFYQFLTGVQERVESGSRRVCSVAHHLVNLSQQHRLLTLLPSPVQACYFTVPRSDGVIVPLRPGGARERVTVAERGRAGRAGAGTLPAATGAHPALTRLAL